MATEIEPYVDHVDFSVSTWKRPEGPTRIWRVVDGRRKTKTGQVPRFSIQEVPKGLENDVVEFMVQHFTVDEPITRSRGVAEDPLAVREIRTVWRDLVGHGISVVALKVDSDPTTKPQIAGVNVLYVETAGDGANAKDEMQFRTRAMQVIVGVQSNLSNEVNLFEKWGFDKCLGAYGLAVDPAFRGQGLGEELLKARDDIGMAYQIPMSKTIFTATASQILASRVGFEVLVERKYTELFDNEGKVAFPGVNVDLMKVMGKRLIQYHNRNLY